jgi:diacylglycerol kinase family enzyme
VSTKTALAIIPGGTANVMAAELGIPPGLEESVTLALNPEARVRPVDMGRIGEHWFLLRAGMGLEAAMVEGADREMKDRFGVLAYGLSALQALSDPPIARYHLTVDGQAVESEGLTCFIANSGTMGMPGLNLAPGIDVSDGMLDVVVVTRADLPGLLALAASVVGGSENPNTLQRWQAREVYVEADPPQTVQVDGELIGQTPITARVIPHAIRIIVPPAAAS